MLWDKAPAASPSLSFSSSSSSHGKVFKMSFLVKSSLVLLMTSSSGPVPLLPWSSSSSSPSSSPSSSSSSPSLHPPSNVVFAWVMPNNNRIIGEPRLGAITDYDKVSSGVSFTLNENIRPFASSHYCCRRKNRKNTILMSSTKPPSSPSTSTTQRRSDQNIIFRPSSDNPEAFDSYKIGAPRVHRYARDDASDDSTYIMWYHGRSLKLHQSDVTNGTLAPLSTGRIGMATSRNGLHWKRLGSDDGSASEDVPGVSLGLNKDSWWSFDTAHVGLGQVLLPMSTPTVRSEGGVYMMYYMGGDHETRPLKEYLPQNVEAPKVGGYGDTEEGEEMMVKGMHMKIGVALSQDGKSWGRVEGEHHTGAIMVPFDPTAENCANYIVRDDDGNAIPANEVEEEGYVGWPEVVLDDDKDGGGDEESVGFTMYYSAMLKATREKVIARAVSKDGFRWEKRGVCLRPSADWLDSAGCARCHVIKRHVYSENAGTWVEATGADKADGSGLKKWIMFYEGIDRRDNKHRILRASSDDGRSWTKMEGVALDVGPEEEDAWDCRAVGSPHILRLDDGTCRLYYTGIGKDGSTAFGVATIDDGCEDGEFRREAVPSLSF